MPKRKRSLVSKIPLERRILTVRGQRVILDADLAEVYGVTTKALNQAVKRNSERFPTDFAFVLTEGEKSEVVTNCDHLVRLKFSHVPPRAFTEHGAIMAANILDSSQAIQIQGRPPALSREDAVPGIMTAETTPPPRGRSHAPGARLTSGIRLAAYELPKGKRR